MLNDICLKVDCVVAISAFAGSNVTMPYAEIGASYFFVIGNLYINAIFSSNSALPFFLRSQHKERENMLNCEKE